MDITDHTETTMEFTPVGRGRGRGIYAGDSDRVQVRQLGFSNNASVDDAIPVQPISSTPNAADIDTLGQLRNLLGELGTQIGDSVVSRIFANQALAPTGNPPSPLSPPPLEPVHSTLDMSKMNIVVKTDVKEPAMYRGDGTDKYTVQEWIDMMEVYLRKKNCLAADQVEEVLSHLLGRAKNIVKVGLKSSHDNTVHPEAIYDILRRYFSDSPVSSLPLADFYATQPETNEIPVDYWVRLNTAAEHADRYLRKCGGKMENMSAEVAMMFIRNCSNPDLASVFKCRPISKWSAMEVQEAIDEHQREHGTKKQPTRVEKVKVVAATTTTCSPVVEESTVRRATVTESPIQMKASMAVASEAGALDRVLNMLESVLARTASPVQQSFQQTRPTSCRVCKEKTHTTFEHCRKEGRCLACLEPGHLKRNCTKAIPQQTQPESHTPNQGN